VGIRALVVGLILCASVVARADAVLRLPVVKDSRSIILRATHIVLVEIVSAADDGVDAEKRPMTKLGVRSVEILKGAIDGDLAATVRVVHYPPGSPARARLYGAWSYAALPVGARFVVFAIATTNRLADVVVDPASGVCVTVTFGRPGKRSSTPPRGSVTITSSPSAWKTNPSTSVRSPRPPPPPHATSVAATSHRHARASICRPSHAGASAATLAPRTVAAQVRLPQARR